ncbi:MAG: hypothetical protein FWE32_09380 [Oscillospiraceae bacterium]|nr:hypothetical protein [Oscillospiraceae bacterium]
MSDQNALSALLIEVKLSVNRRLFEKGRITEEMYIKAKERIIKQAAQCAAAHR